MDPCLDAGMAQQPRAALGVSGSAGASAVPQLQQRGDPSCRHLCTSTASQPFTEPGAQLAAFPLPRCKHNCPSFYHPLLTPVAALRNCCWRTQRDFTQCSVFQRKLNCWAKTQPALHALAKNSFQRETKSWTLKSKLESHVADQVLPTAPPAQQRAGNTENTRSFIGH